MFTDLLFGRFGRNFSAAAVLAASLTLAAAPAHARLLEQGDRPGTVFRDGFTSGSGQGPEMVVLPSGNFMMGSPWGETGRDSDEGPQRTVRIDYQLAVSRHEVTWAEWDACVSDGGCNDGPVVAAGGAEGWGGGSRPVINVSWNDAQAYVTWLNQKTGLTGRSDRYRLLSEAEWEYAARAGSQARWSFGDDESRLGNFAWFSGNSGSRTQPVGGKTANGFGLYDMHGNVWEWVEDCYEAGYSVQPSDGSALTKSSCSDRVFRGGSWNYAPRVLRSAFRNWYSPGSRDFSLGFRLARTLP
jgi:formylglycine-generating enzyme required for sulfatase activity